MKKFALVLAAVCLMSMSAVAFAGCGSASVGYTLSDDGSHYILSRVDGNRAALKSYEVPAVYGGEEGEKPLPVTEIGDEAFMGCTSLYSLTLPEGIERIGVRAFMECAFTSFTIPQSVTAICYGAFGRCGGLREITVPESVTTLEPYAFAFCTNLQKAEVYAAVEDLLPYTFANPYAAHAGNVYTMTSLTEITLPATLKKIHLTALDGNMLEDIYFGGTEEQWDELYFYKNVKLDEPDENGDPVYKEEKVEKGDALPAGIHIHFSM